MATIIGTSSDDSLPGSSQGDLIRGLAGNDTISAGAGNDTVEPGPGGDSVDGGDGLDQLSWIHVAPGFLSIDQEQGIVSGPGISTSFTNFRDITGSRGHDNIVGDAQNSVLDGFLGDDLIQTGAGNDTAMGGAGNDFFISFAADGLDRFFGGVGQDTVQITGDSAAANNFTLGFNQASGFTRFFRSGAVQALGKEIETVGFLGGDGEDTLTIPNLAGTPIEGMGVLFAGAKGDDSVDGTAAGNPLVFAVDADDGNDVFVGGAGVDRLRLGLFLQEWSVAVTGVPSGGVQVASTQAGASMITQVTATEEIEISLGGGSDTVTIDDLGGATADALFFLLGEGDDILNGGATNAAVYADGGLGDDALTGGSGSDSLSGGGGDDSLFGGSGGDSLEGGAGMDLLTGLAGNDTLAFTISDAGVSVNLGSGSVSGGHAQGDTVGGFENASGSGFADTLTGSGGNNRLSGLDSTDLIKGENGSDVILGGTGNDTLRGGNGIDTLTGGPGADRLNGGAGPDRYDYNGIFDSAPGARDVIGGFSSPDNDKIDLRTIDARSDVNGNQAFDFIDTNPFTGTSGELRFEKPNGNRIIMSGDIDGDAQSDFQIILERPPTIVPQDFILEPDDIFR